MLQPQCCIALSQRKWGSVLYRHFPQRAIEIHHSMSFTQPLLPRTQFYMFNVV